MSEKTGRLRSRLCSFNTLPSRYGNGADFHHGLLVLLGHKMDCEFITSIRK